MKREIKFRAKSKRYKGWQYWNIFTNPPIEIISKTLGEYTGRKDERGVEIYEGDIVKTHEHIDEVIWRDDLVGFSYKNDKSRMNLVDWLEHGQYAGSEVIGNIYENPKLLK